MQSGLSLDTKPLNNLFFLSLNYYLSKKYVYLEVQKASQLDLRELGGGIEIFKEIEMFELI
jgi:hypothetical protein